jgi:hypothetical protein
MAEAIGGGQQCGVTGELVLAEACLGELEDVVVAVFDGSLGDLDQVPNRSVRVRQVVEV